MEPESILDEAKTAPDKRTLEAYREAIEVLRAKGYTWREIADFLNERGVQTDHTKVYRLITKRNPRRDAVTIPSAETYKQFLQTIKISDKQRQMLKAHYEKLNRSITYTELAAAAGYDDYEVANRFYGQLGRDLGEAMSFEFVDAGNRPGKFYSSSIGMPNAYTTGDFQLVMHHELAKALDQLHWF